jgi:hypothetical protein
MKSRLSKPVLAALLGALGLAMAGCVDYRPNPSYSHGVAYAPPPCENCAYGNWYRWHGGQWHVD